MPFINMTNDTSLNYLQEVVQDNLISLLTYYPEEFIVRQAVSINSMVQSIDLKDYSSLTPSKAGAISKKLDAKIFIHGSIKQLGSKMRINAQLFNSKTDEVLKSFEIDGLNNEEMIFPILDSLRKMVTNFLLISKLTMKATPLLPGIAVTNSPIAFRDFIYGRDAFFKEDYSTAIKLFTNAITIDSNLTYAILYISSAYRNLGLYEEGKRWSLRAYSKKDQMPSLSKDLFRFCILMVFWKHLMKG